MLTKKKKKKYLEAVSEEIAHPPPPLPIRRKIKWSVPKWIQQQIIEYDIKSKCPEEYSTVDQVGIEKPLGSKSCFVWYKSPPHFFSNL